MIGCCSQEMDTLTQERHSITALLSSSSVCLQISLSQEETGKEKEEKRPLVSIQTEVILIKTDKSRLQEANSDETKKHV